MSASLTQFLSSHLPFNVLTKSEILDLIKNSETKRYKQGEFVISEDELINHLYIVYERNLVVYINSQIVDNIYVGGTFGSYSIISKEHIGAKLISQTDSTCILIPKVDFLKVLKSNIIFAKYFEDLIHHRLNTLYKTFGRPFPIQDNYIITCRINELIERNPVTCTQNISSSLEEKP